MLHLRFKSDICNACLRDFLLRDVWQASVNHQTIIAPENSNSSGNCGVLENQLLTCLFNDAQMCVAVRENLQTVRMHKFVDLGKLNLCLLDMHGMHRWGKNGVCCVSTSWASFKSWCENENQIPPILRYQPYCRLCKRISSHLHLSRDHLICCRNLLVCLHMLFQWCPLFWQEHTGCSYCNGDPCM